jgi:hypothetical protein
MNPIEKFRVIKDPIVDLKCKIGVCDHEATNVVKLYSHYRCFHSKDPNFTSHCLYSKRCFHQTEFKTFWGLNSHLRKYHSTFFEPSFCGTDADALDQSPSNNIDGSVLAVETAGCRNEPIVGKTKNTSFMIMINFIINFVIKMMMGSRKQSVQLVNQSLQKILVS